MPPTNDIPSECDCPEDVTGLLSKGAKNHSPNCPIVAWIAEIAEQSDPDHLGVKTGGFIPVPDMGDIRGLRQRIEELRQTIADLEDRVLKLENE